MRKSQSRCGSLKGFGFGDAGLDQRCELFSQMPLQFIEHVRVIHSGRVQLPPPCCDFFFKVKHNHPACWMKTAAANVAATTWMNRESTIARLSRKTPLPRKARRKRGQSLERHSTNPSISTSANVINKKLSLKTFITAQSK